MTKIKKTNLDALIRVTSFNSWVRTISTQSLDSWESNAKIDISKIEETLTKAKQAWDNYRSAEARKLASKLISDLENKTGLTPEATNVLASTYVLMAETYRYGLTNPELSEENYKKALKLLPDDPTAKKGLADVKLDYDPLGKLV